MFLPSLVIVKLTGAIPCQRTQKEEEKIHSIYTLQALSQNCGKRLSASSYLSVRPHGTTGRIFMKFDMRIFFSRIRPENSSFIKI